MNICKFSPVLAFFPLLMLFSGTIISAESGAEMIQDPGFEDGEESRYVIRSGDEIRYSRTVINRISREDSRYYEITSFDETGERTLVVTPRNLLPLETRVVNRIGDTEYSTGTLVSSHPRLASDQVFVIGLEDLQVILRGYPFTNPRSLRLKILGQNGEDNGFSLTVEYRRQERLELPAGTFTAHKLEIVTRLPGAMSIFRGAIPKNYLWFNSEAPHQLLKAEGAGSFGSGETQVSELVDYQN